jgi:hypothetical protein
MARTAALWKLLQATTFDAYDNQKDILDVNGELERKRIRRAIDSTRPYARTMRMTIPIIVVPVRAVLGMIS